MSDDEAPRTCKEGLPCPWSGHYRQEIENIGLDSLNRGFKASKTLYDAFHQVFCTWRITKFAVTINSKDLTYRGACDLTMAFPVGLANRDSMNSS